MPTTTILAFRFNIVHYSALRGRLSIIEFMAIYHNEFCAIYMYVHRACVYHIGPTIYPTWRCRHFSACTL
ncbi:hypothetical protein XELAEV_18028709mg [Xenopus laevis]|uniref:Uncharacterized protein n=1 Tax=Xenopus laevis TaxID=8355 RepID=A0A974CQR0_XENLA|nr:hypothetical protein XELAEV_18028709mg [Xenopus laevis]